MAGSGSGRKGGSRQSGGAVATRPSILERLDSAKARLNDKMALANDELRKANNALDRNTDASWTPRAQKQAERLRKAERRARSLVKGSRNLKRIALSADPARFGFARGSAQRSKMASDLRAARAQLRTLKARAAAADRTYRESPVVKYGLTSEVGGNRGQSRKAKQRASTRQTSIVDRAVGASMAVTAQRNEIKRLRAAARAQTARTNQSRRWRESWGDDPGLMTATWSFDDRAMEGVEELAYGLPVSLAELPGGELVIAANTDDNDTVLIEVSSLVFWLQHHRPDLLPKFYAWWQRKAAAAASDAMRNVTVTPSQSGPLHFDVFLNGWLYRSALSYAEALALAAELRKQDSAVKP